MAAREVRAGRAFVSVSLRDKGVKGQLKRLSKRLHKFGAGVGQAAKAFTAAGVGILAPLTAAAVKFAAAGDDLAKMADRTGIAADKLSQLKFAAQQSGASIEDVGGAIMKMNRRLGRITAGAGTATQTEAIEELGLSIEEINNMNPEQRFLALADAMRSYGDDAAAAGLAQRAFGTQVDKLLPLFKGGAEGIRELMEEAKEFGALTEEDAEAAAKLTDAMGRVKSALEGVTTQIGAAMAPALTKLGDLIAENTAAVVSFIRENREMIQMVAAGGVALTGIGITLGTIATAFGLAGFAASGLATAIGLIATPVGAAAFAIGTLVAGIGIAIAKFVDWGEVLDDFGSAFSGVKDEIENADIAGAIDIAMLGARLALARQYKKMIESAMEFANTLAEITAGTAGQFLAEQASGGVLKGMETQIGLMEKLLEMKKEDAAGQGGSQGGGFSGNSTTPISPSGGMGGVSTPTFEGAPINWHPDAVLDFALRDSGGLDAAIAEAKKSSRRIDPSGIDQAKATQSQVAGTFSAAAAMRIGLGGANTPDERAARGIERLVEVTEDQRKIIKKRRGAVFT